MTAAVEPHSHHAHSHSHNHAPSPLEQKLTVTIPPEPIAEEIEKRLAKLAQTAKIPGFRPGKVPKDVVKQRFEGHVLVDVLNDLVQKYKNETIKKENIIPATYPEPVINESYESGKPFSFTIVFEVFPNVTLKPFSDLIIEKTEVEITDQDVEKTLENMQKQQATWKTVERPAKENDKIWIKFEGTMEGATEPFKGGQHDNMPVLLGSKSMIPGFEEGLIGATNQQDLTLTVNFPENYGAQELAGKPAKFTVHVNKIEEPLLPELDDAFAQKFGADGHDKAEMTLQKLRDEIKKTLQKQSELNLRQKLKTDVMGKLYDAYKSLDVPQGLVHDEAHTLLEQTQKQFAEFKSAKAPQFTYEMFEGRAKERVALGIVVREIIKQKEIKAEPSKIRSLVEQEAERYSQPDKVISHIYNDKRQLQQMESLALEEQVVDCILSEATIVEKKAKLSEVLGTFQENK